MSEASEAKAKWTGEHTQEPWRATSGQSDDHGEDGGGGFCILMAKRRRTGGGRSIHAIDYAEGIYPEDAKDYAEAAANAERIVQCINALAGIPDPAAHLARCARMEGMANAMYALLITADLQTITQRERWQRIQQDFAALSSAPVAREGESK